MKYLLLWFLVNVTVVEAKLAIKKHKVTITNKNPQHHKEVSMLFDDRYLLDQPGKQTESLYFVPRRRSKEAIKDLAAMIIKRSKSKGLKVNRVQLGKRILRRLGGARALRQLNKYLNDEAFMVRYKLLKRQRADNRREKLMQQKKEEELKEMTMDLEKLSKYKAKADKQVEKLSSKEASRKRHLANLDYLPKAGGIPFPPVAVGGVNYHAPMKVTVNALPYPDPTKFGDPYQTFNNQLTEQG